MLFEPPVEDLLRRAGWEPGRTMGAPLADWLSGLASEGFPIVDTSIAVLSQFGALRVGDQGPGEQCARTVVEFDPTLARGELDRFQRFMAELGIRLTPLGEVANGHALLALGSDGALYFVMDLVWRAGPSFDVGLANLLLGRRGEIREGGCWVPSPP